jgi:hypothetical protein
LFDKIVKFSTKKTMKKNEEVQEIQKMYTQEGLYITQKVDMNGAVQYFVSADEYLAHMRDYFLYDWKFEMQGDHLAFAQVIVFKKDQDVDTDIGFVGVGSCRIDEIGVSDHFGVSLKRAIINAFQAAGIGKRTADGTTLSQLRNVGADLKTDPNSVAEKAIGKGKKLAGQPIPDDLIDILGDYNPMSDVG